MNRDPQIDELLAPLRDDGAERIDRPVRVDRDRVLVGMAQAGRIARSEGGRARRFAMLAAAAGFALIVGAAAMIATRSTSASVDVVAVNGNVTLHGRTTQSLEKGAFVHVSPNGDLTTAAQSEARIQTESGLDVAVFESSRVELDELSTSAKTLRLGRGAVRCRVPRLAPREKFSVVTPDATVVVHGTVFSVEVRAEGEATRTTVHVAEGIVVVMHAGREIELKASESWTNQPAPEPPPLPVAAESSERTIGEASPKPAPKGQNRRPSEKPGPSPGTLDEETRLLRSGLAAERSGDLAGAASSFEQLLSHHPQSPLAPEARAALTRVKARHER
jgi:hypothetical protein